MGSVGWFVLGLFIGANVGFIVAAVLCAHRQAGRMAAAP
jgi:hypothetical protein